MPLRQQINGQSHLADVKYRILISKFDVKQQRPNAMVQQGRIAMVLKRLLFRGLSQ